MVRRMKHLASGEPIKRIHQSLKVEQMLRIPYGLFNTAR